MRGRYAENAGEMRKKGKIRMRKIFGGRSETQEEEEIWREKEFGGERNLTEKEIRKEAEFRKEAD